MSRTTPILEMTVHAKMENSIEVDVCVGTCMYRLVSRDGINFNYLLTAKNLMVIMTCSNDDEKCAVG